MWQPRRAKVELNQSSDENYMHYATNYVDFT